MIGKFLGIYISDLMTHTTSSRSPSSNCTSFQFRRRRLWKFGMPANFYSSMFDSVLTSSITVSLETAMLQTGRLSSV